MKAAIDVTNFFFGLTNGTPIYLYNLVRALKSGFPDVEIHLLYNHRRNRVADQILDELEGPQTIVRRTNLLRDWMPSGAWWAPVHPPIKWTFPDIDVFHGGDFARPWPDGTPIVGSVLDLTTRLFPEHHVWANRWRDGMKLRWMRHATTRTIAISESTKRDYVRLTGADPSRVDVVPLATGQELVLPPEELKRRLINIRERHRIPDVPYILSVGTVEPRKNFLRLIQAFESLPPELRETVQLVVAGGRGWKMEAVWDAVNRSPAREHVHFLGFVSAEDLLALYRHAHAFAYVSLYEGFGLPVLEAMSQGVPVITSDVSSLPEVAGDAGLLVDPSSVEDIRDGLVRILADAELRERLARRGRHRAGEFTWRRTAELTIETYRKALSR